MLGPVVIGAEVRKGRGGVVEDSEGMVEEFTIRGGVVGLEKKRRRLGDQRENSSD